MTCLSHLLSVHNNLVLVLSTSATLLSSPSPSLPSPPSLPPSPPYLITLPQARQENRDQQIGQMGNARAKTLLAAVQGPDSEGPGGVFPVALDDEHAEGEAGEEELDELVKLPGYQLCVERVCVVWERKEY